MCSAFTPDFGYENSTINFIGDVKYPNTKCSGKLCLHKKTFQPLGRSDYQCPQCASKCQVGNILLEDRAKYILLTSGQGVYFFERIPKSIQDDIREVYCPDNFCFNRQKCETLDGSVINPRSVSGCG